MIRQRKIVIRETDVDWILTDLHYGKTKKYKTLASAIQSVKREDKKDSKNNITSVTEIEVDTITRSGKAIAEVLLDK